MFDQAKCVISIMRAVVCTTTVSPLKSSWKVHLMLFTPKSVAHLIYYIIHWNIMCNQPFAINSSWFCTHIKLWCGFLYFILFARYVLRFRYRSAVPIDGLVLIFELEHICLLIGSLERFKQRLAFPLNILQRNFSPHLYSSFNCLADCDFYCNLSLQLHNFPTVTKPDHGLVCEFVRLELMEWVLECQFPRRHVHVSSYYRGLYNIWQLGQYFRVPHPPNGWWILHLFFTCSGSRA
jgi:hypothetical protein